MTEPAFTICNVTVICAQFKNITKNWYIIIYFQLQRIFLSSWHNWLYLLVLYFKVSILIKQKKSNFRQDTFPFLFYNDPI